MRRIVVLGGRGFFGRAIVELLRAAGEVPLVASRSAEADVPVDVEEPVSLRTALRTHDVVIDTVGPFQDRSTALVEAALDIGFDLVDISDSIAYVGKIDRLRADIEARPIRLLTACSAMSAITAAMIKLSGVEKPVRVTGFIAPATRYTANSATAVSLLRSIGQPIQVWRDGGLVTEFGWLTRRTLELPPPLGRIRGYLVETVDSLTLPRLWPTLRTAEYYVDARVPGMNTAFLLAARVPAIRSLLERTRAVGLVLARRLGYRRGGLAYEIQTADETVTRCTIAGERSYLIPIIPAVLAARALANGRFAYQGLVPPNRHVDLKELAQFFDLYGITVTKEETQ
ncbi:MAG: saccharopine dehydrogenase NADP-binding domain-containing protein [Planctomycetes bacterium]|nr:saccharopine dehydrogenase NADP-binding domain-containing protein [Planctomycetota bacterium]